MQSITITPDLSSNFKDFVTIDAHTEGEPLRVIISGYPEIKGSTILEKRQYVQQNLDTYRKLLMHEPRGHADMYGALITEAVTEEADFGVLFLHNEGYSSMCGHGILALVKVMCQTDSIDLGLEPRTIKIDSPAGLITAKAYRDSQGKIQASFKNVDSWADALNCSVNVEGFGEVNYDIGFGGAYYAYVDADEHGISCGQDNVAQLIDVGRRIKHAVMASHTLVHPLEEDLSFLYGTIFTSKKVTNPEAHSRHVCIFADGEVDRSPTGTGVSARVALLYAKGEVALNTPIMIESIVDGRMIVSASAESEFHGKQGVIPEVSGRSFITGKHQFFIDPDDVFQNGFMLR
ncbi:proline racemase family protein [Shewanella pealeana]|uniref:Protein Spea_1705 n=1 Tax=Shewanella pealeana (strain ATCC 700345 / ANG-SQ1) TaxID=398579 RepID=Y1705_SHEPA|nr:proline racemase family protein [Shewanella pealeana]A8H392.1 RecName: Full=Protein Spea_1705 [Shewanella pealeana ATCC 700345]ABV87029.1 proline racemase [Shewanella pealeana ATCC 700345]